MARLIRGNEVSAGYRGIEEMRLTMPKTAKSCSIEEFKNFGITLGSEEYARVYGCERRYAANNAAKLGAKKVAGQWRWSKAQIAAELGLPLV